MGNILAKGLIFLEIGHFSEGLAPAIVPLEGGKTKTGFVNKRGEFVIEAVHDSAEPFFRGLAHIERNGRQSYLTLEGTEIRWDEVK